MEINAQMLENRIGLPVYGYDTLDSTNDECRRRLAAGERRCLVIAETQTGGRGRSGKRFFSPRGGLYMSLALPAPTDPAGLTCRAAVATAQAISAVTGVECGIKWVNDLYLEGKKICGILAEAVPGGVVLGIGVNLVPAQVPESLRDVVGFLDCGDVREALAAEIVRELGSAAPGDRSYMDEYRRRSVVLGREVTCRMGERVFSARAIGIDDEGGLIVLGPEGRETLRAGEVSLKANGAW